MHVCPKFISKYCSISYDFFGTIGFFSSGNLIGNTFFILNYLSYRIDMVSHRTKSNFIKKQIKKTYPCNLV